MIIDICTPASNTKVTLCLIADFGGQLSPKLQKLKTGDSIYVGETAHGDLIHDSIPKQAHDLWLLSTGTGIGLVFELSTYTPGLSHSEHHEPKQSFRYEEAG
jgi:ferredoxin--NADP+ reductase